MTSENKKSYLSRRAFLAASAVGLGAAAVGGSGGLVRKAFAQSSSSSPRVIKLAWGQTAVCQSPISVALKQGLFEKYGLTVEPVNFSGPTDQLLQAIATGKADGGIGMALRWLKPLEQGFDVSLTVGTHGGCMRLLAAPDSGINSIADLKGKKVAVSDQASPIRNFFAIQAAKQGINPDTEIEWLQYPADLFAEALKKGEVQAVAGDDPHAFLQRERDGLKEVATNLDGQYVNSACCVLGLRGSLVRDEPEVAGALSRAIVEAQAWTAAHPDESAEIFAPFVPGNVSATDVARILRSHTHDHHSTGDALRKDVALFVDELKIINVIRPNTNTDAFAEKIVANVIT